MGTPDYGSGPEDHKKPPVVAGSDPEHDMDMAATSGISIDDRALLRKLDWRLMPLLCLTYALQSIDKTTLGYAAVLGLPSELGLTGTELSWAGGIMYLGYLVWEFPASVMLQRWPLPRVLAATTGLWGAVLCCHAAVSGFRGLAAVRALLGALESSVNPGTMLLMSMYYQRREQPFRMGIWIGSAGLGYILAGLVSFGIGHVGSGGYGDSSAPGAGGAGLSSWRIIFLFWGGITVLWAVLLFFTLPDSPARAKGFLNEHERAAVIDRVRVNGTGVENKTFKWAQFREALVDAKTWLLFLFAVTSNCPNGGLTVFQGLVIKGMGFSTLQTTLIQMPSGAWQAIVCPCACYLASRYADKRIAVMLACLAPFLAGVLGLWLVPQTTPYGRLVCLWISFSYTATWTLAMAVATANTAGHTKKVVTNALLLIGYCLGNFVGPFFFKTSQAPRYTLGVAMMLFCVGCQVACLVGLFGLLWWRNRGRRALHASVAAQDETEEEAYQRGLRDETDFENRYFKYVY